MNTIASMPSFVLALALDKSTRIIDRAGRLHVEYNRISKATVNPYLGKEIPGYEELGLDANKIYQLLRDPDELTKAAPTCNRIQLMGSHVVVDAEKPEKEEVAGTLGDKAVFDGEYLVNSLTIWDAAEIAEVDRRDKCEISMGYHYTPDMTPGVFKGLPFDGVMRNIEFNHAALVEQGRAGPDVMVGDEKPKGERMKLKSRAALMLNGAINATVRPLLATDAKVDFTAICADVTAKNFDPAAIKAKLTDATKGKLAADAKLEPALLAIDAAMKDCEAEDDEIEKEAQDEEMTAAEKEAAEKKAAKDKAAKDAETQEPPKKPAQDQAPVITVAAMDAAIAKTAADTRQATLAEFNAIRLAENEVRPHIGDLKTAMDTADAVYRLALKNAGYTADEMPAGTPVAVLRAMVARLPDPNAVQPLLAADSAKAAQELANEFDLSHVTVLN